MYYIRLLTNGMISAILCMSFMYFFYLNDAAAGLKYPEIKWPILAFAFSVIHYMSGFTEIAVPIMFSILTFSAYTDKSIKKIYSIPNILYIMAAIIYFLITGNLFRLTNVFAFLLFLTTAYALHAIAFGDLLLFVSISLCMSVSVDSFILLILIFLMAAVIMLLCNVKKIKKNANVPFAEYILYGTFICLLFF